MKKKVQIIGWREWVCLPDLGIEKIKAKVDTGARSSSIHADKLEVYEKKGVSYARFNVFPLQRRTKTVVTCNAKIIEHRKIRSSNGQSELRPVISTNIELLGACWSIELTLTNRDDMGFRMLLGRESFRKRFLVDAGSSYYGKRNLT
ncbi:MAG: ATP-dependent zinc protease [Fibrobacteria bacterium]|nr:ATP-dependent zinc protease [Fibrobacteria bacterium]